MAPLVAATISDATFDKMDANEVLRKFQEFDKDKNGFVSVCEAETILKKELGFTAGFYTFKTFSLLSFFFL